MVNPYHRNRSPAAPSISSLSRIVHNHPVLFDTRRFLLDACFADPFPGVEEKLLFVPLVFCPSALCFPFIKVSVEANPLVGFLVSLSR